MRRFKSTWAPRLARRGDKDMLERRLLALFGETQVLTSTAELLRHGSDESFHDPSGVLPDVVFLPRCEEEVVEAMIVAKEADAPVIPFGVGTSLEGHVAALQGGLCIDTSVFMDRILQINEEDMDCVVQAGCTRVALNEALRHTGLMFPIDPGANATIGGMTATSASGTTAVRYGTMKNNVMGTTCVLADGTVLKTGSRARKTSAGYDLTSLIVGSEGTLGCITDVTLRLHGQPESVASAMCSFDSVSGAVKTVVTALQFGIPLARAEFLDPLSLQAVEARSGTLNMRTDRPGLFLEFHGTEEGLKEQIVGVEAIAKECDLLGHFHFAYKEEERNKLWKARHEAYWASLQLRPGCRGWPTDICVPLSRLADCIEETLVDIKETGIPAPVFGHVGDGNFHVILLAREDEVSEYISNLQDVNERLVKRALEMGGTCTGEHGIGYGKSRWLWEEHGEVGIETMKAVKKAFDPKNRMNPGKFFHFD